MRVLAAILRRLCSTIEERTLVTEDPDTLGYTLATIEPGVPDTIPMWVMKEAAPR